MTEFVIVRGKTKWFRHTTPEVFMDKSAWKHTLYPDEASLEIIRDLQSQGMKNVLKKDEDGYYINFSRPEKVQRKGQWVRLDPPKVVLNDGKTEYGDMVGNGSDISTKLEVYSHSVPGSTTKKAKAARWLSTRIDNLIPYISDKTFNPKENISIEDHRAIKGLDKLPPQAESWG